jgi:two-component system, NtrC family, response regulator AtoC
MQGSVLVIDDDQAMCELVADGLHARGFDVTWQVCGEKALALLENSDFDVVLTDLHLEDRSGLEICERVLASGKDTRVVLMTAFGSLESAVGAIRAGVYDFVLKPVSMDALAITIERATQHVRLRSELKRLREKIEERDVPSMVGDSPAVKQVLELIRRVATGDASVLITGESGTGKELIAKAIHETSGRQGPFLAINCAAVPETLLESELFGHARGAFTDAHAARRGLFVEAHGGTVFLDEIGEMGTAMQAKILRALQERAVRPVGGSTETTFDARIITATNRDLELDVKDARFRADLYYRINVVRIEVPPLRARGNDALQLAQFFLARSARRTGKPVRHLGSAVAQALLSYDWPGNVRELENCIERAVALASYDEITLDDLPAKVRMQRVSDVPPASDDATDLLSMEAVEDRYIRRVLAAVAGNKTLAAKILGFDRRTLYRKLAASRFEEERADARTGTESLKADDGADRGPG